MVQPVCHEHRCRGFIYGYVCPIRPGFLKIGYVKDGANNNNTTVAVVPPTNKKRQRQKQRRHADPVNYRLACWEADCRQPVMKVFQVEITCPAVERIESLVHITLQDCRRVQSPPCEPCRQRSKHGTGGHHKEWFEMDVDAARHVVDMWARFANQPAYDSLGRLVHFWWTQADRDILRLAAYGSALGWLATVPDLEVEYRRQVLAKHFNVSSSSLINEAVSPSGGVGYCCVGDGVVVLGGAAGRALGRVGQVVGVAERPVVVGVVEYKFHRRCRVGAREVEKFIFNRVKYHAIYVDNIEFYGTFNPSNDDIASGKLAPKQNGFVHEQLRLYDANVNATTLSQQVMNYYTEDQVPVLTSLVQNFVTFNYWHSAIPGPTDPNRLALVAGSSFGHGQNDAAFTAKGFNETSIFQSLTEGGYTWKNYHNPADKNVVDLDNFYVDASAGDLPNFSIINPSCCGVDTTSMHPTGLVSLGEGLIKDVYDAVRGGPQWNETLFIVTYDETGGFHDHVASPLAPRPDGFTYTATTPAGQDYTFDFDRLGDRTPTFLISPWVNKAFVEGKGRNAAGETVSYSATSILRTLGYLFDFAPYNPRVEWSPSFEGLINTEARTDAIDELPEANPFRVKARKFRK
ncbi:hypothetical protein SEUCBS139899_010830 [Sporothrix eucalyptigena]